MCALVEKEDGLRRRCVRLSFRSCVRWWGKRVGVCVGVCVGGDSGLVFA